MSFTPPPLDSIEDDAKSSFTPPPLDSIEKDSDALAAPSQPKARDYNPNPLPVDGLGKQIWQGLTKPVPFSEMKEDVMRPLPGVRPLESYEIKPTDSIPATVGKEAYNLAISIPNFIATPAGAATTLTGGTGGMIAKGAAAVFSAQAWQQAGEALLNLIPNWNKLSTPEKTKAIVDVGGNTLFGALMTKGGTPKVDPFQEPPIAGASLKMPAGAIPPQVPTAGLIPFKGIPDELIQDKPPKVTVPGTAAEPRETVTQTIQKAGAKTIGQIQALFPKANLSREQARQFRNQAWGTPEAPAATLTPPPVKTPTIEATDAGKAIAERKAAQKPAAPATAPPEPVSPSIPAKETGTPSEDYRMEHRPNSEGPQAHDLLSTDLAPRDIYDRPDFYTGEPGSVGYRESVAALRKIRGKPDATVTIYRASPKNTLNEGDWVSFSKSYSKQHGMADDPSADVPVHAFKVKAKDVRWAGDTLEEFGYYPEKVAAKETGNFLQAAKSAPKDTKNWPKATKPDHEVVFQSYGEQGRGFYQVPKESPPTPKAEMPAQAQEGVKEPWQMTRDEFSAWHKIPKNQDSLPAFYSHSDARTIRWTDEQRAEADRSGVVRLAFKRGEPIPPEVLADYPDLAKSEPSSSTGLTEEKVNQERDPNEPIEKDTPISNEQTLQGGIEDLKNNPNRANEIMERLRTATPEQRSISRRDAAVLLAEKRRLVTARDAASKTFEAPESTPEQKTVAKQFWNDLNDKIDKMDQAAQDARSVWGGFGQFWQRMLKEDYTFDALRRKASIKLDRPLTDAEKIDLQKKADEFADASADAEKKEADYQASISDDAAKESHKDLVSEVASEGKTQTATAGYAPHILAAAEKFASRMDARAKAALERFKARGTFEAGGLMKFHSGVEIPFDDLKDLAEIGAAKITRGVVEIAKFTDEMISEIGEGIRPFIDKIYAASKKLSESDADKAFGANAEKVKKAAARKKPEGSRDLPAEKKSIIEGTKEAVADGADGSEINRYAKELAKNFVRQEVENGRKPADIKGEEIDAAVHDGLKEALPEITPLEARDAWTGYGKFKPASKDPIKVRLSEASAEQQKLSTLERLQKGLAGLMTGFGRTKPTDLVRRRIAQINELQRQLGIKVTDAATQLRSALDAKKTRQKNRIADLKFENATRKRIVRSKTPSPDDEVTLRNKAEIAELEKQNKEIFGNKALTDEQKLKMATAAAEKNAAMWEQRAADARAGKYTGPKTKKPLTSQQIEAFRKRSEAAKAAVKELQDLDEHFQQKKAEAALPKQLAEIDKQIEEVTRQINEGDIASKKSVPKTELPELTAKKSQLVELNKMKAKLVAAAKGKSPAEREAIDLKNLQAKIDELSRQINEGDLAQKPKTAAQISSQKAALRATVAELNRMKQQLINAAKPKKTPEEIAVNSRLTRLKNQEADLTDRIARNDFTPKPKPAPKIKSQAALQKVADATARVEKLKQEADKWAERKRLSERTPVQKLTDALWHLARTGASTVAVSFHGTVFMVTHAGALIYRPSIAKTYWTNFARQFKLWASEKFYNETAYKLKTDPDYADAKTSGVDVDPDKAYTDYEYYLGSFGKHLGAILGARGALALKVVRLQLFKDEVAALPSDIKADPEQYTGSKKQIADMVNKSTGVTNLFGQVENLKLSDVAHFILFAPKLYASRWARIVLDPPKTLKTLSDMALSKSVNKFSDANWKEPTKAEQQIAIRRTIHAAEFAVTYLGVLAVNQGLLSASGSNQKVNFFHPSKSDWLKFKVHGKVVTADGGLLDPMRLIGQIVANDLMARTSKDRYERGNNFEAITRDVGKYVRGKFSPSFGLLVDEGTGQDFEGRSVPRPFGLPRVPSEYKNQTPESASEYAESKAPIPIADASKLIHDTMVAKGISSPDAITLMAGAAAATLAATGVSDRPDYETQKNK